MHSAAKAPQHARLRVRTLPLLQWRAGRLRVHSIWLRRLRSLRHVLPLHVRLLGLLLHVRLRLLLHVRLRLLGSCIRLISGLALWCSHIGHTCSGRCCLQPSACL